MKFKSAGPCSGVCSRPNRPILLDEVYEPDGRPVTRRFYQAEVPFAWNAGLYVYAVHELGLRKGPPA